MIQDGVWDYPRVITVALFAIAIFLMTVLPALADGALD